MLTTRYLRHPFKGFVLWDALSDITHLQMSQALGWPIADLRSAGFVQCTGGMLLCTGLSGSLGIGSHPGDTRALLAQLGMVQSPRHGLQPVAQQMGQGPHP